MSKQMLELADELESIRKRGHFPNDSLIEDVVAALRSSAVSETPVAWRFNTHGDQKWRAVVVVDEPTPTALTAFDKIEPLYTHPVPSASVREALKGPQVAPECDCGGSESTGHLDGCAVLMEEPSAITTEQLTEWVQRLDWDTDLTTADEIRQLRSLLQHIGFCNVPQSASEWCQPTDRGQPTPRKFMIYFDDPDHGIMVFDDEAEARKAFEAKNTAWSCYLLGTLPRRGQAENVALQDARDEFEAIRLLLIDDLAEPGRSAFWKAVNARDKIAALSRPERGDDE